MEQPINPSFADDLLGSSSFGCGTYLMKIIIGAFVAFLCSGLFLQQEAAAQAGVFVVFFSDESDAVDAGGQGSIQEATDAWWHTKGKGGVWVIGYTDLSFSQEESQRLSEQRAKNVAAVLGRLGVPETSLFVEGRGENDPRVPTAPGVREPQNQRVELVILSEKQVRQAQKRRDQVR
jgi:hypothetical protein